MLRNFELAGLTIARANGWTAPDSDSRPPSVEQASTPDTLEEAVDLADTSRAESETVEETQK